MARFRLGPGLLVSAAFIDPGTIVTASTAGAGIASPLLRGAVILLMAVTILLGNAAFQAGNLLGASLGFNALTGLHPRLALVLLGLVAAGLLLTGRYRTIQNVLVVLVIAALSVMQLARISGIVK